MLQEEPVANTLISELSQDAGSDNELSSGEDEALFLVLPMSDLGDSAGGCLALKSSVTAIYFDKNAFVVYYNS